MFKITQKIRETGAGLWNRFKVLSRWKKAAIIVVFITIALTSFFSLAGGDGNAARVKTAKVQKQDLERVVFTSGSLEAENQHTFFSSVESTLMELKVKAGDRVKKGDVLGRLDTLELERRYQEALSNLAGKEADLAKARASNDQQQLNEAQAAYNKAKNHYERVKALYEAGAVNQEELETAEADMQRSLTTFEEARVKKEQSASQKQVQALTSQADLARQEAALAKERLDLGTLTAGFDGVVVSVSSKEGDRVQEGTEILVLAEDSKLQVTARVNEVDAGELKEGQTVGVTSIALPGENFEGAISRVGGAAVMEKSQNSSTSVAKIPVQIKLTGECSRLKFGYSVNLTIKTMVLKEVLTVPSEAIVDDQGKKTVWVLKNGILEKRAIEIQRGNELKDIVLSGLQEGEEVVKNPAASLIEGQKAMLQPEEAEV
ncbi:MAG: efflux RND transporter periplasmic adaptor subunit [Syntrophomonadaceae bacterium]